MSKGKWIICDLDGTLCEVAHRQEYALSQQWDEFNSRCKDDGVVEPVRRLVELWSKRGKVMYLTGRDQRWEEMTRMWLFQKRVDYAEVLLMRPKDDYRPDWEVKLSLAEEFFGGKEKLLENVAFVLDDRAKVVEEFRNYGLTVFQVREGDY